ncbi:MAG: flavodoxin [Cyclobacteriaceae bacterium]
MDLSDKKFGLFFGSETGNTEDVTNRIVELWKISELEVINAAEMTVEDYERFDIIMIGLSTWYDGELQSNFDEFFDDFNTIDFSGKVVALYGLGDQVGYPEFFVDSLGILGEVILNNGGKIVGMWPREGYDFDESKGLYNDKLFYGLPLDFENQMDMTQPRIEAWLKQVENELKDIEMK